VAGLGQERIEATAALHGLERMGADAQAHLALQGIADQRHVDQIRPKRAFGLVFRMAAQLAGHGPFARQLAPPRHSTSLLSNNPLGRGLGIARRSIREPRHVKVPARALGPWGCRAPVVAKHGTVVAEDSGRRARATLMTQNLLLSYCGGCTL